MFGNVLGRPLKLLDQMSIWNYTWKKFPVGEFYIMERILKVSPLCCQEKAFFKGSIS